MIAQEQLRRGLLHAYRRVDLRLPVVRGRLRVAAQLAKLPQRIDVHLLEAHEFTADTDINRAIKGGIRQVQRFAGIHETHLRCRELLARLDAVADTSSDMLAVLFRRLVLDRRHVHLEPLIRILGLIVTGHGSAAWAGESTAGPTLLFSMDRLFEAYVAERMRKLAHDFDVRVQGPGRSFATDGRFNLVPDVIVFEGRRPALILDTKWKLLRGGVGDVASSDLQQAFTYARIYGVGRTFLLYPGGLPLDCVNDRFTVNDGSSTEICIQQLPLLGKAEDLDKALVDVIDQASSARCSSQHAGNGRSSCSSITP